MQVSFDALALQLVSFGFSPVLYCKTLLPKGWRLAQRGHTMRRDDAMPSMWDSAPRRNRRQGFHAQSWPVGKMGSAVEAIRTRDGQPVTDELEEREIIRRARVRHHLEASRGRQDASGTTAGKFPLPGTKSGDEKKVKLLNSG
jgi:hypothetical protein